MAYDRYTVPLIAVSSLFVGALYHDVVRAIRALVPARPEHFTLGLDVRVLRVALVSLLVVPIAVGIGRQAARVVRSPEAAAYTMAADVTRLVEPVARTQTYEWQLDVFTERPLDHPPEFPVYGHVEVPSATKYLIDGPWSKMLGIYSPELAHNDYERIAVAGDYELYRRRD
jgi:hypothetical protein